MGKSLSPSPPRTAWPVTGCGPFWRIAKEICGSALSMAAQAATMGKMFVTFTTEDGLQGNWVSSIMEDRQGTLWFGAAQPSTSVSRYDGTRFTAEEGLVDSGVLSILEDRQGHLWFTTQTGVSRYDGERVTTFTYRERVSERLGVVRCGGSKGPAVVRDPGWRRESL